MKRTPILLLLMMSLCVTALAGQRLSVKAALGNIRSGPGTNYEVLWQVEKYYPVLVIKKTGSWYHFRDFEGDKGWIHKSLVGKQPTVITKEKYCNVRSGPGTKHAIQFSVEDGIPFKVIKRKGNWLQVEHADGDRGWIHKSLIW